MKLRISPLLCVLLVLCGPARAQNAAQPSASESATPDADSEVLTREQLQERVRASRPDLEEAVQEDFEQDEIDKSGALISEVAQEEIEKGGILSDEAAVEETIAEEISKTGIAVEVALEEAQPEPVAGATGLPTVAVMPFRVHSARPLGYLTESLGDLLASRMEAGGQVEVLKSRAVIDALGGVALPDLSEEETRKLAERLGVRAIISGSITELAGRFSLDIRLTMADGGKSKTVVIIAGSEEELLGRLDELADRVVVGLTGSSPDKILRVDIVGAGDLEGGLRGMLTAFAGVSYDPAEVRRERARLEEHPEVASVDLEVQRTEEGVILEYRVIRSDRVLAGAAPAVGKIEIVAIEIRGNRRIDSDAIRTRISSAVGVPLREAQVASDVRGIFGLGFFRDVSTYVEDVEDGQILIFEVEENPVVRQITIEGNENIAGDKIKDALTLTTGSTLDRSLLHQNVDRIQALYRSEGYFLAEARFTIETIVEGSVAIHFQVDEKKKLRLKEIVFKGNNAFSGKELSEDFATKIWRPWSYLTSWFDQTGTYSEPIFLRDLRSVEKIYSDAGYLQVELGEPDVIATEKGITVVVDIHEGSEFRVGEIKISGDESVDFDALRKKLKLETDAIFNRSHLTEDVDILERHYTDRGFYFASVQPATQLSQDDELVDVEFIVKKGPLYFIRKIDIAGNTRTIDSVIRREMQLVEGQLYSARDIQVSNMRVSRLGFFEDAAFEPRPTEDPSQLDLGVDVVERPTGSFSFGAGFSSQDGLVFQISLAQNNLFGRGYGVSLTADLGRSTSRYFLSITDPYFLDSNFSASTTFSLTNIEFNDFKRKQQGFSLRLGHALNEENTARGFANYSFSRQEIRQDSGVNASSILFRELLQGTTTTSQAGISFTADTRNDRFAPNAGVFFGGTLDMAGLGGFARFARIEGRWSWYMGAPKWLFDRSTFVISLRGGYVYSFNDIGDYDFSELAPVTRCDDGACFNGAPLNEIDKDLTLPLSERYFLGGVGGFQLRGFKARSVGPRRATLYRPGIGGIGSVFTPVGREETSFGSGIFVCNDTDDAFPNTQGNKNGKCNDIDDKKISDFEDLQETDVIGGDKFLSMNLEYRLPVSEEVGLQAVLFFDGGNAYAEDEDMVFDVTDWRYGYGGGLLWFSPFGPLQVVLGFPVDPLSVEDSPVFEFSVGGFQQ